MVRQSGKTISNISIDYLVKKDFKIFINFNYDGSRFQWTATRDDLNLYASNPAGLVALYMIRDDWTTKKQVPNYYKELIYGDDEFKFISVYSRKI